MSFTPSNCTAIITGASSGLGAEFARQLAAKARCLVLVARRAEVLEVVKTELLGLNPALEVRLVSADLGQADGRTKMIETIWESGLRPNLLINNAGLGDYGSLAGATAERLTQQIEVNISAVVLLTHALLPLLKEQAPAGIINISSLASTLPMPDLAVYAASKAFVTSFSEALTVELARLPPGAPHEARIELLGPLAEALLWGGDSAQAVARLREASALVASLPPERGGAYAAQVDFGLAVALMRLGEDENCVRRHNEFSCIAPIQGAGVHTEKAAATEANALFARLWAGLPPRTPLHYAARWLLNITAQQLGVWPAQVPAAARSIALAVARDGRILSSSTCTMPLGRCHSLKRLTRYWWGFHFSVT
jgi:NADP-dependent 3-hydroxy acid dehydrogenase YdfG